MGKLSGALIVSVAIGMLPWGGRMASAADFAAPHTFAAGGVISADELNERFDNLEQTQIDFTEADLVGTWNCPAVVSTTVYGQNSYTGWTLSSDGLTYATTYSLTFAQTSGTLYLSTSLSPGTCPFTGSELCNLSNKAVRLINGYVLAPVGSFNPVATIKKRSNTRFQFSGLQTPEGAWSICDKQNIPPLKPSGLTASASGTSITLMWTDNSADETGFDILRKDAAAGAWTVVATAAANATTYVNTSVTAGTHWYRVVAKNANGSSLGSNVAKVTN